MITQQVISINTNHCHWLKSLRMCVRKQ